MGQFVTIVYAALGIPMTMLCLQNIGDLMAGFFRWTYRIACVNMTYQYIKVQRRHLKRRFVTRLRTKTHDLKKWAQRKQSEVSTMIHTAIDEHMHGSSGDIHRKHRSHSDFLDTIEESADDVYEGRTPGKKLNMSSDDIQTAVLGAARSPEKQRRNTIHVFSRTHGHKVGRKHSLTSSKHHKSRDSLRHAKSHDRQITQSGLIVITEDEVAADIKRPTKANVDMEKASTVSSNLSLQDFEADELALKSRLKQTRNFVPISICLLIMIGYVILGAMIFTMWEENWDFLIGFYFCFITLTTIGFGDFVPGMTRTDGSWDAEEKRSLCVVYLLLGMALLAMSFHLIQDEVRHKCAKIAEKLGALKTAITRRLDAIGQDADMEKPHDLMGEMLQDAFDQTLQDALGKMSTHASIEILQDETYETPPGSRLTTPRDALMLA